MARKKRKKKAPEPAPVVEETAAAEPAPGLPRFKSHKTVEAFKIHSIESLTNDQFKLLGLDHFVIVDGFYVDRHRPEAGGYYVRYADGYQSWSPAAAFEEGYTPA